MLTEHVPPVQQSASAEVNGEDGPQIAVYEGPLQTSPWADLLCFGGLGPGEVTVDGAKLVGISQRRTRAGARFQMAIHRRFEIADLADVWAAPPPAPQDLPPVATLERFGPIVDLDLVDLLASELSA
jgi:lipoate-protein ligase A